MLRNNLWGQHECCYQTGACEEKAKSFHIIHWWDFWHMPLKFISLPCNAFPQQQSITCVTLFGRSPCQQWLELHSYCNASLLLWMPCARGKLPLTIERRVFTSETLVEQTTLHSKTTASATKAAAGYYGMLNVGAVVLNSCSWRTVHVSAPQRVNG